MRALYFGQAEAEEKAEDENHLPEDGWEIQMLGEGEGPGMPEAPDEEGGLARRMQSQPHFRRTASHEERGDGDHHDVEGEKIAAFPEEEDIVEQGQLD